MKKYIEREAAIEFAKKAWAKGLNVIEYLEEVPAADVAEVRHGEWILSVYTVDIPDTRRWHEWHCSNCGYVRKAGWENTEGGRKPDAKYCEHCMAKMDGGAQ